MAGTVWTHFVPHDPDVEAAIAMTDEEAEARAAELVGMALDHYRGSMWPGIGGARPEPRDDLDRQINRVVLLSLDNGTHSVLDVAHASPTPVGAAERWFGSDRPTRRHIEERPLNGGWLPRRWHAWAIDVYDGEGGDPVELCFLGNTGD